MNRYAVCLFTVLASLGNAPLYAESNGGPDMFRTIERFEVDVIDRDRRYTRNPIRIYEPPPACPEPLGCADLANIYREPKFHGEPVVSEDDY